MKLLWRRRAEQQLRDQLQYLREISPRASKRMRTRIKQRLSRLKNAPLAGRPSRAEGVRELVITGTPYIAVYEVVADTITILASFMVVRIGVVDAASPRNVEPKQVGKFMSEVFCPGFPDFNGNFVLLNAECPAMQGGWMY